MKTINEFEWIWIWKLSKFPVNPESDCLILRYVEWGLRNNVICIHSSKCDQSKDHDKSAKEIHTLKIGLSDKHKYLNGWFSMTSKSDITNLWKCFQGLRVCMNSSCPLSQCLQRELFKRFFKVILWTFSDEQILCFIWIVQTQKLD